MEKTCRIIRVTSPWMAAPSGTITLPFCLTLCVAVSENFVPWTVVRWSMSSLSLVCNSSVAGKKVVFWARRRDRQAHPKRKESDSRAAAACHFARVPHTTR
jgi:hypothetical protein